MRMSWARVHLEDRSVSLKVTKAGAFAHGMSLLSAKAANVGLEYLYQRGWNDRGIAEARFQWFDCATVERLWPKAMSISTAKSKKDDIQRFVPIGAVALPFPNDPTYFVARVFYKNAHIDAKKFLTPGGRECIPYIPRNFKKAPSMLRIIESPFKAALAFSKGVPCIGVHGCDGCHIGKAKLPPLPHRKITRAEARNWFRPELLPYLKGRQKVEFITDADCATNLQVRRAQLDFMDAAHGLGCTPCYRRLPRGGLDDYLVRHSVEEFYALRTFKRESRHVDIMRNPFRELTEFGVSDRFVAMHRRDLRFDPKVKQWFVWATGYWQSSETMAFERMRSTIATLKDEANAEHQSDSRKARGRVAVEFQKEGKCKACLSVASNDMRIHIDAAEFDSNCNLLGVQNGTFDLKTWKLLEAKREHMVTVRAASAFNPKATAPLFLQFISRACGGDEKMVGLCQEVCGAVLLGRAIRMELTFAYGPAFTGKSVLIEVMGDMLGDYATAIKSEILLRRHHIGDGERPSPFLVSLRGKRLVTCSELPENTPIDDALVKDLTGGDMITARGLHKAPIKFRNTARIIVRCNHLPVVTGSDDSIWGRLMILPFTVVIPAEERDVNLREKIAATELSGVLNWALEGLRRYLMRDCKFEVPKIIQEIVRRHRRDSDVIGLWLEERWTIDKTKDKAPYRTLQSAIGTDYRDWCQGNGNLPMSTKNLWAKLRERCGYDPIKPLEGGHKWALGWMRLHQPSGDEVSTMSINSDHTTLSKLMEKSQRQVTPIDAAKRRAK